MKISRNSEIEAAETSPATITDNIISNCSSHDSNCGITGTSGNYTITRNIIEHNSIGIQLSSANGFVTNNTIINNSIGINIIEPPKQTIKITYNNIYSNNISNFYLGTTENNSPSSFNINATNNWWGTTNEQTINQSIFDFKNDPKLGNVTFIPFLEQPNPEATPTIPEFPIGVILPLMLMMSGMLSTLIAFKLNKKRGESR